MKKLIILFLACSWLFLITAHAEAALFYRGMGTITGISGDYKLIYDDVLDVTWLDYSNTEANWADQTAWAQGLEVTFGGRSFGNWRLPRVDESVIDIDGDFGYSGPDSGGNYDYLWGYYMINSEMGHLFYETLGNKGWWAKDGTFPQPGFGLVNTNLFDNLQDVYYWSEIDYSLNQVWAWGFGFGKGVQMGGHKNGTAIGIALMPGDISAVPISGAIWLFSPGLMGLFIFRSMRSRRG